MKKLLLAFFTIFGSLVINGQICSTGISTVVFSPIEGSNDLQLAVTSNCCQIHHFVDFTNTPTGSEHIISMCYHDTGLLMPSTIVTTLTLSGLNTVGNENFTLNATYSWPGTVLTCENGNVFNAPLTFNLTLPLLQPRTFVLSENEFTLKKTSLFPNPNSGNFTLQLPTDNAQAQITVTDVSGKRIFSAENYFSGDLIQLQGFSKGLYFAKILCNQTTQTLKFMIE